MNKKTTKEDGSNIDKSTKSISMSSGYELTQALTKKDYNPSLIDNWYSEQRKANLKYAKQLVCG